MNLIWEVLYWFGVAALSVVALCGLVLFMSAALSATLLWLHDIWRS